MTVTDTLADFALGPVRGDQARAITKLSLFDWAACGIAGARHGGFDGWAKTLTGQGEYTSFAGPVRDAPTAALLNGTLSHALDFDDTHFAHIGHPSVAIMPAVLALGHDWDAMIDAALIGVEGSIRVGVWLGRGHYQVGYHQTATAGAFGATMTAGRLLGLDAGQMRHALGLCATMASGLKAQFGTMGKPLNAGLAARTGVEAAQWAKAVMTSDADGLGSAQGFGATHHGAGDMRAFDGLGTDWKFEAISHKFHACCHGLHAVLEGLAGLTITTPVKALHITTHPRWMSVCNIQTPATGLECKFSYRHTAAMTIAGISTGAISSFSDELSTNPELAALRNRITVDTDETLTEMQSRLVLSDASGEQQAFHDLAAPLEVTILKAKLQAKATGLVGPAAGPLWSAVETGDLAGFKTLLSQ